MKHHRQRPTPSVPEIQDPSELPGPDSLPPHRFVSDQAAMQAIIHPLRSRILMEMMRPQTISQVAETLNMQPARVFYYVRGLVKIGLLELKATRRYRGAQEKYYQATARSFDPDPSLADDPASLNLIGDALSSMLRRQHREARLAFAAKVARRQAGGDTPQDGLAALSQERLVLTRSQMETLVHQIRDLINQTPQLADDPAAEAYHVWLTVYPEADADVTKED